MPLRETDLYPPVKAYLESQGYDVKGEVSDCDVVGLRDGEDPVVVELKTAFTLQLVFQGVQRQTMTNHVYLAFAIGARGASVWKRHYRDVIKLCRLLGLGLITVRIGGTKAMSVEVRLDPAPYQPRKNTQRRGMLLQEFERRVGDPNKGGSSKRPIVTAYRQDALRCAKFLHDNGPAKAAVVRAESGADLAPRILLRDVYGWFRRVERGIYEVTPAGKRALKTYAGVVASLMVSFDRQSH